MGGLILTLQATNFADMSQMPSDPLHAIVIFLCFHQALIKYGAYALAHSCWEAPEGFDS